MTNKNKTKLKSKCYKCGGMVNPHDFGGILASTASGALGGAAGGPVGALIGAGTGLIGGLLGSKKDKEAKKAQEQQEMMMRQQQLLAMPTPQGGLVPGVVNPYQIGMQALGGPLGNSYMNPFAMGGNMNQLETYDSGGTHEENPLGGIPVGMSADGGLNTVEEGESSFNFPDGKYIYSDRLVLDDATLFGLPSSTKGKSYSEAAKKIDSLFKGRQSKIDSDTKKAMMTRLRKAQDQSRQEMQAMQESAEQPTMEEQQFAYGGKMYAGGGLSRGKDYGSKSNPYPSVKSGDFAGGGRSYPIPTKADAVDALRLAGLHGRSDVRAKVLSKYPGLKKAYGGKVKYQDGGVIPYNDTEAYTGGMTMGDMNQILNPLEYYGDMTTPGTTTSLPGSVSSELPSITSMQQNPIAPEQSKLPWDKIGMGASLLGQAAPLFSNIAGLRGTKPSGTYTAPQMAANVQPELVNRQQIERNLTRQLATNREALSRRSSGNFGQYAANLQALNMGSSTALANATLQANLADAQERARAEQMNLGIEERNIGRRMQADQINAQNMAAYEAQRAAYRQGIGQSVVNVSKSLSNFLQSKKYMDSYRQAIQARQINPVKQ